MKIVDQLKPGSFTWVELATTDQNAAKNFYGSLFGWQAEDSPMGPGQVYTTFKLQGKSAAAGYTLQQEQAARGVPPHWMVYVGVTNADATAARAAELGGKVPMPPFDVFTYGRMAVLQDPTGAVISVWQNKTHTGIQVVEAEGTLCWADLITSDPDRAGKFYSNLFGWKLSADTDDNPPSGYTHIQNGEDFIGGIPPAKYSNPNIPAHWMVYFQANDCFVLAEKARSLGAKFHMEPTSMENVGKFAVLADPQGASFALFQSTRK